MRTESDEPYKQPLLVLAYGIHHNCVSSESYNKCEKCINPHVGDSEQTPVQAKQPTDPFERVNELYAYLLSQKGEKNPITYEEADLLFEFNADVFIYATFKSGRYKNRTANIRTPEQLDVAFSMYDINLSAAARSN